MSKNIIIQEGGVGKQLTTDKLKTNLVGGGTCLWVPEDEVQLGTKYINEDGTYNASDDGYYGYFQVTVSGIGKAVGTDGDGDKAIASIGSDGIIQVDKLPSSIEVTTPPTKTTYQDGEAIDFAGMVVKAYLGTGGVWSDSNHSGGVIPISELTLPVQTADYGSATHSGSVHTDFDIVPNPFSIGSVTVYRAWSVGGGAYRRSIIECSMIGAIKLSSGYYNAIFASEEPASVDISSAVYAVSAQEAAGMTLEQIARSSVGTFLYNNSSTLSVETSYTYGGKTAYYGSSSMGNIDCYLDIDVIQSGDTEQIAWSMLYGDIEDSGMQTIPVQWSGPSYGDGTTLESSFTIHVEQSMGGATGGGGQAGDNGAGRYD